MEKARYYTTEEVSKMDGHIELVAGKLVIQDYTTTKHNEIVSEIAFALKTYIKEHDGKCKVYQENVALWCSDILKDSSNNFFLPDIMVVCNPDRMEEDGIHGTPDFVAEVTSESTRSNDFAIKLSVYQTMGVKEYWIIDEKTHSVYKYLLEQNYAPMTYFRPLEISVDTFNNQLLIDFSSLL